MYDVTSSRNILKIFTISIEYIISAKTLVWLLGDGGAKPRGLLVGSSSSESWYWAPVAPFRALFFLYIL